MLGEGSTSRPGGAKNRGTPAAEIRKILVQLRSPARGLKEASQGGWSCLTLSAQDDHGPRSSRGCGAAPSNGAPAA
eukprot:scaffold1_cov375-Pavlova_lutheri.AAC.48